MGNFDFYYSHRGMFALCQWWERNESAIIGDLSEWILKNRPSGSFYAKEVSQNSNQKDVNSGVYAYDVNQITLQSHDDIEGISRGCIVQYQGRPHLVESVNREIHLKQSEFNKNATYVWIINLRR